MTETGREGPIPEAEAHDADAKRAATVAAAELDYRAAMAEIGSNVDVRRLMFVIANVLVPALLMAASDAMSGTSCGRAAGGAR